MRRAATELPPTCQRGGWQSRWLGLAAWCCPPWSRLREGRGKSADPSVILVTSRREAIPSQVLAGDGVGHLSLEFLEEHRLLGRIP